VRATVSESGSRGARPESSGPVRRCAWTRVAASRDRLFRFVLGPDGVPVVDLRGRAPGRGVYLSPDRSVLREALSPKGLGRVFRGRARADAFVDPAAREALLGELARGLERQFEERASLARRARDLVLGADPVLEAGRTLRLVVVARDVSERTWGRIQKGFDPLSDPVLFRFGTQAGWGRRLGTKDVGVWGVRPSTLGARMAADADRYRRLTNDREAPHGAGAETRNEERGT
jgi:predicted RNA-binding protein YlxR (DUF448 family)